MHRRATGTTMVTQILMVTQIILFFSALLLISGSSISGVQIHNKKHHRHHHGKKRHHKGGSRKDIISRNNGEEKSSEPRARFFPKLRRFSKIKVSEIVPEERLLNEADNLPADFPGFAVHAVTDESVKSTNSLSFSDVDALFDAQRINENGQIASSTKKVSASNKFDIVRNPQNNLPLYCLDARVSRKFLSLRMEVGKTHENHSNNDFLLTTPGGDLGEFVLMFDTYLDLIEFYKEKNAKTENSTQTEKKTLDKSVNLSEEKKKELDEKASFLFQKYMKYVSRKNAKEIKDAQKAHSATSKTATSDEATSSTGKDTLSFAPRFAHCQDERAVTHLEEMLNIENLDLSNPNFGDSDATRAKLLHLLSDYAYSHENHGDAFIRSLLKHPEKFHVKSRRTVEAAIRVFYEGLWKQNRNAATRNSVELNVLVLPSAADEAEISISESGDNRNFDVASGVIEAKIAGQNTIDFKAVHWNELEKPLDAPLFTALDSVEQATNSGGKSIPTADKPLLLIYPQILSAKRRSYAHFFQQVANTTGRKITWQRHLDVMEKHGKLAMQVMGSKIARGVPYFTVTYV